MAEILKQSQRQNKRSEFMTTILSKYPFIIMFNLDLFMFNFSPFSNQLGATDMDVSVNFI